LYLDLTRGRGCLHCRSCPSVGGRGALQRLESWGTVLLVGEHAIPRNPTDGPDKSYSVPALFFTLHIRFSGQEMLIYREWPNSKTAQGEV
jgi:hypothetical protein